MATKLKNNWASICQYMSIVAAVIGIVLIGRYTWRYIDTNFAETIQLLLKLF